MGLLRSVKACGKGATPLFAFLSKDVQVSEEAKCKRNWRLFPYSLPPFSDLSACMPYRCTPLQMGSLWAQPSLPVAARNTLEAPGVVSLLDAEEEDGKKKETVVILSKYKIEHSFERGKKDRPVQYFDTPMLTKLMEMLIPRFHVVYVRPRSSEGVQEVHKGETDALDARFEDHVTVMKLGAYTLANLTDETTDFVPGGEVRGILRTEAYNRILMATLSRSTRFISIQGGGAHIATLFGGTHITFGIHGNCAECDGDMYPTYSTYLSDQCIHSVYVAESERDKGYNKVLSLVQSLFFD